MYLCLLLMAHTCTGPRHWPPAGGSFIAWTMSVSWQATWVQSLFKCELFLYLKKKKKRMRGWGSSSDLVPRLVQSHCSNPVSLRYGDRSPEQYTTLTAIPHHFRFFLLSWAPICFLLFLGNLHNCSCYMLDSYAQKVCCIESCWKLLSQHLLF
jgi:hypothetical protein